MAAIEIGKKCVKKCGRDIGQEVEIVKTFNTNFVMVKDAKGKESKCAITHLEPKG